jgi:hypothetical protein
MKRQLAAEPFLKLHDFLPHNFLSFPDYSKPQKQSQYQTKLFLQKYSQQNCRKKFSAADIRGSGFKIDFYCKIAYDDRNSTKESLL